MEYREEREVCETAAKPSIIEYFKIEGLHGYRNIGLSSDFAATILIAQNGSGKTTLLGALDAFLKTQFNRLSHLNFDRIVCKLREIPDALILERSEIDLAYNATEETELTIYAKRLSIEPSALIDYLESFDPDDMHQDEIFEKILSNTGAYNRIEARRVLDKMRASLYSRSPKLEELRNALGWALAGVEVVYLPTYRRIELPLNLDSEDRKRYGYARKKRNLQSRLGITKNGLYNADIQFGLSDISDRLATLNQEILFNSNQSYREISANIINELLDGEFERTTPSASEIPDKDALNLFFSRIREGRNIGPFRDVAIPNMDKIYNNDISPESNKFLTFFLGKLNSAIEATRGIELVVEEFITNCNRYLSTQDQSTNIDEDYETNTLNPLSFDDKKLTLDRKNLKVSVESIAKKRRVSLDTLSSGEKQMISLFARLYLYPRNKIILIDEPELSLSLDWQRKILVDVINAPSCKQVVAITHSPFVFDNALEPFAKALQMEIVADTDEEFSGDEDDLHE